MGSRTLPGNAMTSERDHRPSRPWWPWTRRLLTLVFFVAVFALLVRFARNVDWDDVFASLRAPAAPGPAGGDRLRAGQPPPVQLLRPDRAALHRARTGDAQSDGGQLHQLRLQPEPRVAGGRRSLPLSAVLAAGAGQRRDHSHPDDEHADQLAGLHVAGRFPVPRASAAAAAQLEARQRWPAMAGRRPGAGGGGVLRGLPALGRTGLDRARARDSSCPIGAWPACSWPCHASTGA